MRRPYVRQTDVRGVRLGTNAAPTGTTILASKAATNGFSKLEFRLFSAAGAMNLASPTICNHDPTALFIGKVQRRHHRA